LGREVSQVSPEALARIRACSWPGNIRELQIVLKQALLRASGPILLPAFLPELTDDSPSAAATSPRDDLALDVFISQRLAPEVNDLYAQTHAHVDRLLLARVLEYTGGNQHHAARLLGIARQTLRIKLRDLGLHVAHAVEADDDRQSTA